MEICAQVEQEKINCRIVHLSSFADILELGKSGFNLQQHLSCHLLNGIFFGASSELFPLPSFISPMICTISCVLLTLCCCHRHDFCPIQFQWIVKNVAKSTNYP